MLDPNEVAFFRNSVNRHKPVFIPYYLFRQLHNVVVSNILQYNLQNFLISSFIVRLKGREG